VEVVEQEELESNGEPAEWEEAEVTPSGEAAAEWGEAVVEREEEVLEEAAAE
jgi:hypothetical protein